ncbi:resistance to homoserine/threonine (RhtB) family protein [Lysobacter sp. yr284]|uniref:LysE family transporter n=1 Tax=Lysobacter sp. yr284 TaxID=1761791 RepID=UPI00089B0CF4|nr:LysE family transporter [Lysobacter sp. yr284]SDY22739.1 resistance to homoserine/threonine (RhtB) family protein [Lysobacter sp. yr284]
MQELLAIVTITTLAVISPGPDFAMVSRNSLLQSRRAGVLTALGIALGVWVHVGYTLLGVGLLIRESIQLYAALKLLGALYLVWLGAKMLRSRADTAPAADAPVARGDFAALRAGFLTNALNPKCTVFVVSLFLQAVGPQTPLASKLGYGAFVSGAHLLWFALVALLFSQGAVRARLLRWRIAIDRAFGALLVGFGALLAGSALRR